MVDFLLAIIVVRRLAEIDDAAAVVSHIPRKFHNIGMLAQVFLEEPVGIHPVEHHEHHQNHPYAYQQLFHGQNWK